MPSRRPPTSALRLTSERIVDTALEIVRTAGYDALSMRSLAAALDTGQSSLYAHVANKTELDRLLLVRVLVPALGGSEGRTWRQVLADNAEAWRRQLAEYPGLVRAYFGSAPTDEVLLQREEELERLLREAGLDARQAGVAHVTVFLFVAARSLEDAVIAERVTESGLSQEEWFAQVVGMADDLPEDDFPFLRESLQLISPASREWLAREAVEVILDGIEARYLRGHDELSEPRGDEVQDRGS